MIRHPFVTALLVVGMSASMASASVTYLTSFTKTNNIYTNLNEQFPHSGTGVPGSKIGTPNASFLFDPTSSAVTAAGYAPNYVSGSNAVNNGIDFLLTSNVTGQDFDEIDSGQTTTVPVNLAGVQMIYALVGAYNGQTISVTLTGADSTTQTFSSVSIPDFNGGSINTSGTNFTDQTVFETSDVGAGGTGNSVTGDTTNYDLTELAFTVSPGLSSQSLSSISFSSSGYEPLLLGVTAVSVPEPAGLGLLLAGLLTLRRRQRS